MRYGVLVLLCIAAVLAYVQRTALSVPSKSIQLELGISPEQMGLVMGCWYWAYGLLQIPSGWLADRWGSKRAMLLYVVVWSSAVGLVGLAGNFYVLLILWASTGLAQAGLVPTGAKTLRTWFPEEIRAFASGFFIASMALGSALASLVAGILLEYFSWREMLALYVVPGLIWAVCFSVIVPRAAEAPARPMPAAAIFEKMSQSMPMILLCLQMFLRAGAMAFFYTWFPRFLQETRGVSESESGALAVWPGVAAMIGGLMGGTASDLLLRVTGNQRLSRQGLAVLSMSLCAVIALIAHFVANMSLAIGLISIGAFWGTLGGVAAYPVAIDLGGKRVATVFSVMNAAGSVGAGLFAFMVGQLVAVFGNWEFVLIMFSAVFAADAVCWAFLNPKGPLFDEEVN